MSKQGDGKPVKNNTPKSTGSPKSGMTSPPINKKKTISLPDASVSRKKGA